MEKETVSYGVCDLDIIYRCDDSLGDLSFSTNECMLEIKYDKNFGGPCIKILESADEKICNLFYISRERVVWGRGNVDNPDGARFCASFTSDGGRISVGQRSDFNGINLMDVEGYYDFDGYNGVLFLAYVSKNSILTEAQLVFKVKDSDLPIEKYRLGGSWPE